MQIVPEVATAEVLDKKKALAWPLGNVTPNQAAASQGGRYQSPASNRFPFNLLLLLYGIGVVTEKQYAE